MTDELARKEITLVEVESKAAFSNLQEIIYHRREVSYGFLNLARLLKENRDKGYFKLLGYETFEAMLADPQLALKRSTAYMLMGHYQLYIEELKRSEDELAEIGSRRLSIIKPVVKRDPDTWLSYAREMSKSDLQDEVRDAQGLPPVTRADGGERSAECNTAAPCGLSDFRGLSPVGYITLVKQSPCCVCGTKEVDGAHFPRTKGAGAEDWKVIPLCRRCHTEQHNGGMEWVWENRVRIFDWFYGLIGGGNEHRS